MRLIDADALLPMMKYATTDSEIGVFPIKIGFNAIAKVIDDTPTVDAVPVRWIENWIQSKGSQTVVGYHWIMMMLKDWAEVREE